MVQHMQHKAAFLFSVRGHVLHKKSCGVWQPHTQLLCSEWCQFEILWLGWAPQRRGGPQGWWGHGHQCDYWNDPQDTGISLRKDHYKTRNDMAWSESMGWCNISFVDQPPRAADLPPICPCLLLQETPPQEKFTHIPCSKIMIFGREIFNVRCAVFEMTN